MDISLIFSIPVHVFGHSELQDIYETVVKWPFLCSFDSAANV